MDIGVTEAHNLNGRTYQWPDSELYFTGYVWKTLVYESKANFNCQSRGLSLTSLFGKHVSIPFLVLNAELPWRTASVKHSIPNTIMFSVTQMIHREMLT